jgi:hypothetical protein
MVEAGMMRRQHRSGWAVATVAVIACLCAVVLIASPARDRVELLDAAASSKSLAATAKAALEQLEGKTSKKPAVSTTKPATTAVSVDKPATATATAASVRKAKAVVKKGLSARGEPSEASMVSASEVHKIMNTMMKAAAARKQDKKAKESKTDRIQDRILTAKDKLASVKLQKSKDFALYEKSNEEVDDAKSKALEAHDEYQEDMERERSYKKRLQHLQQKLANHLTGSTARNDLNNYYAHLNKQAIKSIPKKIREADMVSTHEAALYKNNMEQHHKKLAAGTRGRDAARHRLNVKKTVSLKEFPQVNVWDNHHKEDVIDNAEKKLKEESKDADREILKSEQAKIARNQ